MTKVVDLAARRRAKQKKEAPRIDKETYELWMFSHDIDALVAKAVVEKGLALDEVAAILAHRLGTLSRRSDHPERLVDFCKTLLERLSTQTPPESPTRVG